MARRRQCHERATMRDPFSRVALVAPPGPNFPTHRSARSGRTRPRPCMKRAMGPPKRTDQETLKRLLDSGKLDAAEGTEIQQALDGLLAGKEVTGPQRLRAS